MMSLVVSRIYNNHAAANLTVLFLTDPGGLFFFELVGEIFFRGLKMFCPLPEKRV
jgi:hypothetical protein